MCRVTERTLACLLLAVAAYGLPWQRCASDCHDRLLPAIGAHACHDEPCGQRGAEADHERIQFVSLRAPTSPVALALPERGPIADGVATRDPTACAGRGAQDSPADGEPPTFSTVLLI